MDAPSFLYLPFTYIVTFHVVGIFHGSRPMDILFHALAFIME